MKVRIPLLEVVLYRPPRDVAEDDHRERYEQGCDQPAATTVYMACDLSLANQRQLVTHAMRVATVKRSQQSCVVASHACHSCDAMPPSAKYTRLRIVYVRLWIR